MPGYDGTGRFTRNYSWQQRESVGVGIVSDEHDTEDDEFAKALNVAFCRDGQSQATGDWNLANHKITNLGAGTADGDAVTLAQLTGSGPSGVPDFKKSINLIGSDANGRVNFRSATGVQGIGWVGADLSWLAKLDEASKTRDRLVLNNKFDGTGTDVAILDDEGNFGCTSLTYNLSHDTGGIWRTIAPGYGSRLWWDTNGQLVLDGVETATTTDPYVNTTLNTAYRLDPSQGNAIERLYKVDKDGKSVSISGFRGANERWRVTLGTGTAEDGTFAGSDFSLASFNNAGALNFTVMTASRKTGLVAFPQGISGTLILPTGVINSPSAPLILGGNGSGLFLRPNGSGSAVGQTSIDGASGDMTVGGYVKAQGYFERSGTGGSFGTQVFNSLYSSSSDIRCYVGNSLVGYWTPSCDYRIKREIRPLPSSWDAVKALHPVVFKPAAYGGPDSPFKDEESDNVGFLAHELQETLGEHAATGVKDGEQIQGPNVMAIVAALTSALQEAQLRIEALEARLAAT